MCAGKPLPMGAHGLLHTVIVPLYGQDVVKFDISSTGAGTWTWRISQGQSTAHPEEMLHLLLLAPRAGGSFPPSYLMAHHALPQPHQTCLAEAAVLPRIQGRSNQEGDRTTGKNKPTKEPPTKQNPIGITGAQ